MGNRLKKEHLLTIWDRYQRVGRRFKSKILDELCSVCGLDLNVKVGQESNLT
jgi:hypothetical protein